MERFGGILEERGDGLRFRIPSLPSSMNAIYQIIFSMRRVEMKPEVRAWKHQAKMMTPPWKVAKEAETGFISLKAWFNADWYHKNGKLRKMDMPNLEKVLIDAVSEAQGWDDSLLWHKESWKVQSDREFVDVELGFIPDATCLKPTT